MEYVPSSLSCADFKGAKFLVLKLLTHSMRRQCPVWNPTAVCLDALAHVPHVLPGFSQGGRVFYYPPVWGQKLCPWHKPQPDWSTRFKPLPRLLSPLTRFTANAPCNQNTQKPCLSHAHVANQHLQRMQTHTHPWNYPFRSNRQCMRFPSK